MDDENAGRDRGIEPVDPEGLEARLREVARHLAGTPDVDGVELRHLVRVLTGCSLLLTDVYSDERIARIMQTDRGLLSSLVGQLLEQRKRGAGESLYRIRRL